MHADFGQQSRQNGIPQEAGRLLEFSWRRKCPHLVEQHGGAHITVDLGQRHEQLGPLVVAEVVQLDEPALQDGVWVISSWNEELWDALNGALLQVLDHVVVLGQGLGLGKPAANLGLPELGETALMVLILLATAAKGPGEAALFPRMLGEGRPAPRPAFILQLGVSMAKTWLRAKTVAGHHCKSLKSLSLQAHLF